MLPENERDQLTVSLKVDNEAKRGIIADVKLNCASLTPAKFSTTRWRKRRRLINRIVYFMKEAPPFRGAFLLPP